MDQIRCFSMSNDELYRAIRAIFPTAAPRNRAAGTNFSFLIDDNCDHFILCQFENLTAGDGDDLSVGRCKFLLW